MNARHVHLSFALLSSGLLLAALLLVLSPHSPTAQAELPAPPDGIMGHVSASAAPGAAPRSGTSESVSGSTPMTIALAPNCAVPIVQTGSVITGINPAMTGRLIRNGVPSVCGRDYTCSGLQSLSTKFSYEAFNFINPSPDWQCVRVTLDARGCGQQIYSAAYRNPFNPADQCANILGAMGFSTSGVYGYSFMLPPSTNFSVVNNTTGVVPPSSNCASYVMTTTLCSTDLAVSATKRPSVEPILADSTGKAVVPVDVVFHNTGNFSAQVNAGLVAETVSIAVQDGAPASAQATFGHAGAIVLPGETVTETVQLAFSGSQFPCLPRDYQVTSQLVMTAGVYACNGFNPPSADVYAGSLLPSDSFSEDSLAFQSLPGTHITATVDTVSAATAFDIEAYVSGTPRGPCLAGLQGDDDFNCTFPPPSFGCPRFGGLLPADPDNDNIYYLRVNSGSGMLNFAGPQGNYRATVLVTSGPTGMCPMVLVLDNGNNSFLASAAAKAPLGTIDAPMPVAPSSTEALDHGANSSLLASSCSAAQSGLIGIQALSTTFSATVLPINITVPPATPSGPGCGRALIPLVSR